jgi:hypothetical protein
MDTAAQSQVTQTQQQILNNFVSMYMIFIQAANGIQCNLAAKTRAFQHFDDGFLWMKEAILAQAQVHQSVPPEDQALAAEIKPNGAVTQDDCVNENVVELQTQ